MYCKKKSKVRRQVYIYSASPSMHDPMAPASWYDNNNTPFWGINLLSERWNKTCSRQHSAWHVLINLSKRNKLRNKGSHCELQLTYVLLYDRYEQHADFRWPSRCSCARLLVTVGRWCCRRFGVARFSGKVFRLDVKLLAQGGGTQVGALYYSNTGAVLGLWFANHQSTSHDDGV